MTKKMDSKSSKTFLRQAGVSDNDVALNDGSGLSRNDLISANSTIQLLTFMSKHKYFAQFREALADRRSGRDFAHAHARHSG